MSTLVAESGWQRGHHAVRRCQGVADPGSRVIFVPQILHNLIRLDNTHWSEVLRRRPVVFWGPLAAFVLISAAPIETIGPTSAIDATGAKGLSPQINGVSTA